jgi:hypothetical protein
MEFLKPAPNVDSWRQLINCALPFAQVQSVVMIMLLHQFYIVHLDQPLNSFFHPTFVLISAFASTVTEKFKTCRAWLWEQKQEWSVFANTKSNGDTGSFSIHTRPCRMKNCEENMFKDFNAIQVINWGASHSSVSIIGRIISLKEGQQKAIMYHCCLMCITNIARSEGESNN